MPPFPNLSIPQAFQFSSLFPSFRPFYLLRFFFFFKCSISFTLRSDPCYLIVVSHFLFIYDAWFRRLECCWLVFWICSSKFDWSQAFSFKSFNFFFLSDLTISSIFLLFVDGLVLIVQYFNFYLTPLQISVRCILRRWCICFCYSCFSVCSMRFGFLWNLNAILDFVGQTSFGVK